MTEHSLETVVELANRYRQARDLCGGEDPVEWIEKAREERGTYGREEWLRTYNAFLAETQKREACEADRDSLLDLVQWLLDDLIDYDAENDNGKRLIEEARAKVAEIGGGNPHRCSVCGTGRIGPHEGDRWCPRLCEDPVPYPTKET